MSQGMRAAWRSWGRPGRSRRSLGLLTVIARHYQRPAAPTPRTLWLRTVRPWSQACALPCGLLSFPVWFEVNPLAMLVRIHPRVEGLPAARAHARHESSCPGGPWLVSGCWLLHVHCRDHLWDHVSCGTRVLVAVGKYLGTVGRAGGVSAVSVCPFL